MYCILCEIGMWEELLEFSQGRTRNSNFRVDFSMVQTLKGWNIVAQSLFFSVVKTLCVLARLRNKTGLLRLCFGFSFFRCHKAGRKMSEWLNVSWLKREVNNHLELRCHSGCHPTTAVSSSSSYRLKKKKNSWRTLREWMIIFPTMPQADVSKINAQTNMVTMPTHTHTYAHHIYIYILYMSWWISLLTGVWGLIPCTVGVHSLAPYKCSCKHNMLDTDGLSVLCEGLYHLKKKKMV